MRIGERRKVVRKVATRVFCCECGASPAERGEICLREAGWEGFSKAIPVRQTDGSVRWERLGTCPKCVPEEARRG